MTHAAGSMAKHSSKSANKYERSCINLMFIPIFVDWNTNSVLRLSWAPLLCFLIGQGIQQCFLQSKLLLPRLTKTTRVCGLVASLLLEGSRENPQATRCKFSKGFELWIRIPPSHFLSSSPFCSSASCQSDCNPWMICYLSQAWHHSPCPASHHAAMKPRLL